VKLGKINKTKPDARSSFNHRRFRTNQPILVVPQKLICLKFDANYGYGVSCPGPNCGAKHDLCAQLISGNRYLSCYHT